MMVWRCLLAAVATAFQGVDVVHDHYDAIFCLATRPGHTRPSRAPRELPGLPPRERCDLRVGGAPLVSRLLLDAAEVDAWLWRRSDGGGVAVEGDEVAYAEWRSAVDQPLE